MLPIIVSVFLTSVVAVPLTMFPLSTDTPISVFVSLPLHRAVSMSAFSHPPIVFIVCTVLLRYSILLIWFRRVGSWRGIASIRVIRGAEFDGTLDRFVGRWG